MTQNTGDQATTLRDSTGVLDESPVRIRVRAHPWQWFGACLVLAALAALAVVISNNKVIIFSDVPKYLLNPLILSGVRITIFLTVGAMILGIVLGLLIALMGMSGNPVMQTAARLYVWIFRATPALVQLIFWFDIGIVIPNLAVGIPMGPTFFSVPMNSLVTPIVAALLGLGLHEAAHMAEIVRAGLIVVPRGQIESALALAMPPGMVMRRIVIPQAMRAIIPPTGNQVIGMLKGTSLVSVIAAGDLLTQATRIYNANFRILELLIVATLWYLVLTAIATVLQGLVERRFSRGATGASARGRRHLGKIPVIARRTPPIAAGRNDF